MQIRERFVEISFQQFALNCRIFIVGGSGGVGNVGIQVCISFRPRGKFVTIHTDPGENLTLKASSFCLVV